MPIPSSRAAQDHEVSVALDGEREGRARACVANRVLGEVARDDTEHARPDRELDVVVAAEHERDSRSCRTLLELLDRLLENGTHRRRTERDDPSARLELAEKEDLVDELRDLVDLAACLLDEGRDVLARKRRRLEQGEKAGERCSKLVRDGCREPGAQLLVRGEVALAREVDEALAPAAHFVRHDERDHPALAREEVRRQRLALAEAVDGLPSTAARVQHTVGVVEDDDRLAALLDEHASPGRVGVRHVTSF